jgi:hypothetical protein
MFGYFDVGTSIGLNWPDPLRAVLGFAVSSIEPSEVNCVVVVLVMINCLCYSHQVQV